MSTNDTGARSTNVKTYLEIDTSGGSFVRFASTIGPAENQSLIITHGTYDYDGEPGEIFITKDEWLKLVEMMPSFMNWS